MREDETEPHLETEEINLEHVQLTFYVFYLSFLIFFFFMEGLIHKIKPLIGHQTVATIVLGIIWSVFWYYREGHNEEVLKIFEFSQSAFFDFLLPPIIYNSGFNMKRKSFFTNLGNVMIFGLGVTLFCFIEYSALSYVALNSYEFTMTKYVTDDGVPITKKVEYSIMNLLLFTSLLCSSDVVAAVSIVDFDAQPKLFSCIFGEGVTNDIVSIIMFNAVMSLQSQKFTAGTPFLIIE
jgi:NhaP-type Na+/H+ or K+/H+ antiporter